MKRFGPAKSEFSSKMEQPSKNRPSIEFRGIRRGGYDKYADGRLMRLTAAFPQLGLGIRVFKANATMMHGRKAAKGSSGVEIGVHQFASSSPRRNFRNTRPFSSLSSSDQESRNRTSVHFHAPVSLLALPCLPRIIVNWPRFPVTYGKSVLNIERLFARESNRFSTRIW